MTEFEDLSEVKEFLTTDGEELSTTELCEIVRQQQDLDLFLVAYHYA